MALVAVTRLRPRSYRYLPRFFYSTWRIVRQARRAEGFVEGQVAHGGGRFVLADVLAGANPAFWTITVWRDAEAMRTFRDSSPHADVMPGMSGWVEEASFVHWERERPELPGVEEARHRMREEGRLSPVDHPSEAQAAGEIRPEPELQEGVVFRPVDGDE